MNIKKGEIEYEIKQSCVKMYYRRQCVVYGEYNCSSFHNYRKFVNQLVNSSEYQYDDLNKIFRLARRYGVRGESGTDYRINGRTIF